MPQSRCAQRIAPAVIEMRMEGAFFSNTIIGSLEEAGVEYSISVPFERFAKLKKIVESRSRWRYADSTISYLKRTGSQTPGIRHGASCSSVQKKTQITERTGVCARTNLGWKQGVHAGSDFGAQPVPRFADSHTIIIAPTFFKRPALWDFMQINTIRQKFIQCVGRLIQPQGELMLSMNMSGSTQAELLQIVGVLERVA